MENIYKCIISYHNWYNSKCNDQYKVDDDGAADDDNENNDDARPHFLDSNKRPGKSLHHSQWICVIRRAKNLQYRFSTLSSDSFYGSIVAT